jgi:hypothetical protein
MSYWRATALLALVLTVLAATSFSNGHAQSTNLVRNPGCESDTGGWYGYQGTLSRADSIAHSGTASCQVTYSSGGYYTLDDSPATVSYPALGAQYLGSAWVRSSTAVGSLCRLFLGKSAALKPPLRPRVL